ncbi:hypothetical protein ACLOJK_005012 [Asimina triloba]
MITFTFPTQNVTWQKQPRNSRDHVSSVVPTQWCRGFLPVPFAHYINYHLLTRMRKAGRTCHASPSHCPRPPASEVRRNIRSDQPRPPRVPLIIDGGCLATSAGRCPRAPAPDGDVPSVDILCHVPAPVLFS